MLMGLFAVADTLVLALLGEKWLICVPFLRIMCVSYCFWPIHITNLQAINAVGRSDIFLKLELVKKALRIVKRNFSIWQEAWWKWQECMGFPGICGTLI